MHLTTQPLDDATWPGPLTPDTERKFSRFNASWADTLVALDREVDLTASDGRTHTPAVLEVAFPRTKLYRDGTGVHADARNPRHPGVALSFVIPDVGPFRLCIDRYKGTGGQGYLPSWQANVRAIVNTLEALRTVSRHGGTRTAEQYRGFAALGSGTPMGAGGIGSDLEAATLLATAANDAFGDEWVTATALLDPAEDRVDLIRGAYRDAIRVAHPDAGGDPAVAAMLTEARDRLLALARR